MGSVKAKYWTGVLYTENMIEDWQVEIDDILQLPFAYCIHDKCFDEKGERRKEHVHIILCWAAPTTYNHAFNVFDKLSKPNKEALNKIEDVISIRAAYEYLIHDTATCRKKNKHLYPKENRITGNNFDIGSYEQISAKEKNDMCNELCQLIIQNCITNFSEFYMEVFSNYDSNYFEVVRTYSGLFERLTKGNFQRLSKQQSIRQTQGDL